MKRRKGSITTTRTTLFPNEIAEVHKFDLTANGTKLLFGLAQCIDHTEQLFPEHHFDMQKLCEYLGVEHRGDRYQVVRDAFHDIGKNPLMVSTTNAKRWSMRPWLSADFDEEDSNYVKVHFDEKVRPYLLKMNGYVKLRGRDYIKLTSSYATTLYPFMKTILHKHYGDHEVSIERLMEMTFTDNKKKNKSYHDETYGVRNFLLRVLGVKGVRGSLKLEPINDKNKKGNEYTSAIKQINELTDLKVRCERVKDGGKTVGIRFYVESKKKKVVAIANPSTKTTTEETKYLPDAHPMSQVHKLAKATGKTASQILRETKRKVSRCGRYAIRANDEWVKGQRQKNLFEKGME
jgi:hypothetical protein